MVIGLGYNTDTVHIYNLQMYIYVQIQYTVKYTNSFIQKKNNVCTLKSHFFKKKIGTGVFCTKNIQYMLLYHHTCHTCTCVTHTSVPS